jgi:hypothetical protein
VLAAVGFASVGIGIDETPKPARYGGNMKVKTEERSLRNDGPEFHRLAGASSGNAPSPPHFRVRKFFRNSSPSIYSTYPRRTPHLLDIPCDNETGTAFPAKWENIRSGPIVPVENR